MLADLTVSRLSAIKLYSDVLSEVSLYVYVSHRLLSKYCVIPDTLCRPRVAFEVGFVAVLVLLVSYHASLRHALRDHSSIFLPTISERGETRQICIFPVYSSDLGVQEVHWKELYPECMAVSL